MSYGNAVFPVHEDKTDYEAEQKWVIDSTFDEDSRRHRENTKEGTNRRIKELWMSSLLESDI